MNYRKYDIVEIEQDGKLVTAEIQDFGKNIATVIIHDTPRQNSTGSLGKWMWRSYSYPTITIKLEDIKRVVRRKRGKGYKKKYDIKLIDEDGNIIE